MFDSLVLIVILSFLIPFFSVHFVGGVIPSVAIEIIVGLSIGKSGLDIVAAGGPIMEFLSYFGLIYLMFLGGLESDFDFKGLRSSNFLRSPMFIAISIFILTIIFSYIFSLILISVFHSAKNPFYITLIFSTTSVAIVFPTLKARLDIKKAYKQTLTSSALIADFTTLIMITAYAVLKEKQNGVKEIFVMFGIFIFAFILRLFINFAAKKSWVNKTINMLKHKSHIQIGIRGSFAILFAFLFLAEKLGVEIILGSFIAGILISNTTKTESEVMQLKLDAMGYGFFIPFFFIYQGAKSEIPIFTKEGVLFILVVIGGSYIIKLLASLPLKLRFSFKETVAGGFLLSGRLSLIIAASIIGLKLGIIDNQMNSAIILLAAFSCVVSPSLFSIVLKQKSTPKKERIIVVGGGRVGSDISRRLIAKQKPILLIEKNEEKCKNLKAGCMAELICGDAQDMNLWRKVNPTYKDTALLVTNSDDVNLKIADLLQDVFGVYKIFARDNDPQNRQLFKQKSVTPLVYSEQLIRTIENAIENPITFELISGSEKNISERAINRLSGKTIKQSGLSSLIEVILIKRTGEWLYPSDDLALKKGDIVVFIVDKKNLDILNKVEF
jgi:Kef-type K+ transport system membrane component KefB/Trk K+ transport system NAD-binding subunit